VPTTTTVINNNIKKEKRKLIPSFKAQIKKDKKKTQHNKTIEN
jgi:hypothetical protein